MVAICSIQLLHLSIQLFHTVRIQLYFTLIFVKLAPFGMSLVHFLVPLLLFLLHPFLQVAYEDLNQLCHGQRSPYTHLYWELNCHHLVCVYCLFQGNRSSALIQSPETLITTKSLYC